MAVRSPRLIVSVLGLIIVLGVLAVSCSKESPTSPMSAASTGKATISGTLVNATPEGQAGDPLPGVAVRAAGTRQSTQTDEAGRFTLSDLPAGQVELEFRGPGFQSSIAIHALAGQTTRVTVALNRGRSTVTLLPRSEGNDDRTRTPTPTGTLTPRPTRTPENEDEDRTRTPTPTGTLTPRPTRTPEIEDEDRTRTPTPTGTITPATPRPTRTPENDDDEERTRTPTPTGTITPAPTRTPEGERD